MFNLVGSPYKDSMCEERLGGDHVVRGAAFGVGNTACSISTLVRGKQYALTECMDDGTVYAKVFDGNDQRCQGDVRLEMLMFTGSVGSGVGGGICALGKFKDGRREYYR